MNVLIIKMTSMGDVIHTLPALTDAQNNIGNISFDWIIEETFQEIPAWHSGVDKIIPVAFRRWRKTIYSWKTQKEIISALKNLRSRKYDLIIDAQGLLKSAIVGQLGIGKSCGYARGSSKEFLASPFYREKYFVDPNQHAVSRARKLFSQILKYPLVEEVPDYGLSRLCANREPNPNRLVFLMNTTWPTKNWPKAYWDQLLDKALHAGYQITIPCGNSREEENAKSLARDREGISIATRLSLTEVAKIILNATGVVAVDTGLAHLSAALEIPTVSLYGATDSKLTGTLGKNQIHLDSDIPCAPCLKEYCSLKNTQPIQPPCFAQLTPDITWEKLRDIIGLALNE